MSLGASEGLSPNKHLRARMRTNQTNHSRRGAPSKGRITMLRRQILTLAASALALGSLAFGVQAEELKDPFPVKGKVTVADFGAKWCAGCPEMEKIMIELQKEYGDRAAFVVVDIDKYQGIENKYLIEQLPSQMFFDAKGEPIWIHTGSLSKEELRERVDILLAGPQK